jgi:hypothetical protein
MLPFLILGGLVAAVVTAVATSDSDSSSSSSSSSGSESSAAEERKRAARREVQRYANEKLRALAERERVSMSDAESIALAKRLCDNDGGVIAAFVDAVGRRSSIVHSAEREFAVLGKENERLMRARAILEAIEETA